MKAILLVVLLLLTSFTTIIPMVILKTSTNPAWRVQHTSIVIEGGRIHPCDPGSGGGGGGVIKT
jgi:fatty acid desaturase